MGRRPIGDRAMTGAERVRRHRERLRTEWNPAREAQASIRAAMDEALGAAIISDDFLEELFQR